MKGEGYSQCCSYSGDNDTTHRIDSCSRNVYQYEDLKECVSLDKMKDHFIFTVESVGASSPQDLVSMGWDVIIDNFVHFIGAQQDSEEKQ